MLQVVFLGYVIEPTADQEKIARGTIQVASAFERQRLDLMGWGEMNKSLAAYPDIKKTHKLLEIHKTEGWND